MVAYFHEVIFDFGSSSFSMVFFHAEFEAVWNTTMPSGFVQPVLRLIVKLFRFSLRKALCVLAGHRSHSCAASNAAAFRRRNDSQAERRATCHLAISRPLVEPAVLRRCSLERSSRPIFSAQRQAVPTQFLSSLLNAWTAATIAGSSGQIPLPFFFNASRIIVHVIVRIGASFHAS